MSTINTIIELMPSPQLNNLVCSLADLIIAEFDQEKLITKSNDENSQFLAQQRMN